MYPNYGTPNYIAPMMNMQVPGPPACPGGTVYTIQPGDTMFRIANRYGIDLQALIRANPQIPNPNVIYVGQRICIPAIVTPPPPPGVFCPDGTIYIVQRGDTMFNIARRFGVTLQKLIEANPQVPDPNILEVGQRICIPVSDAPLPEGIRRVLLRPERTGILGATAFVSLPDATIWISTFGLPAPSTIDPKLKCYYAWVVNRGADRYYRVTLKDSGAQDIMVGYGDTTGSFVGYDEVIVTAEATTSVDKPTGPVVLRGNITP
ncbi:spore coat assembly protein SafA [Clostridium aceticum]|uniref:Spore coat assembly protein SafA n=1 Tax=Clostridium aceticum TaxID=84022 RepID=A0A0G3WEH2_9CLOT|nr:SafA/ExsA family spore coat assembly protein [Clostridium aceticum]AKL96260.1 spore coat assembly protein SafA [Clostridium aceticum]